MLKQHANIIQMGLAYQNIANAKSRPVRHVVAMRNLQTARACVNIFNWMPCRCCAGSCSCSLMRPVRKRTRRARCAVNKYVSYTNGTRATKTPSEPQTAAAKEALCCGAACVKRYEPRRCAAAAVCLFWTACCGAVACMGCLWVRLKIANQTETPRSRDLSRKRDPLRVRFIARARFERNK